MSQALAKTRFSSPVGRKAFLPSQTRPKHFIIPKNLNFISFSQPKFFASHVENKDHTNILNKDAHAHDSHAIPHDDHHNDGHHDGHDHDHHHDEGPHGYFGSRRPLKSGQVREKEGWEYIYGIGALIVLLFFGIGLSTADESFSVYDWAQEEIDARKRSLQNQ